MKHHDNYRFTEINQCENKKNTSYNKKEKNNDSIKDEKDSSNSEKQEVSKNNLEERYVARKNHHYQSIKNETDVEDFRGNAVIITVEKEDFKDDSLQKSPLCTPEEKARPNVEIYIDKPGDMKNMGRYNATVFDAESKDTVEEKINEIYLDVNEKLTVQSMTDSQEHPRIETPSGDSFTSRESASELELVVIDNSEGYSTERCSGNMHYNYYLLSTN